LADFQNSFADILPRKLQTNMDGIQQQLNISPHSKYVATPPPST